MEFDIDYEIDKYINEQADQYVELDELLKQKFKGIELIPSHANFILVYSSNISLLKQLFEDSHIVIRTYPDKDYVRITIGNKEENQKVFEVLKQFEKEIL